MHSLDVFTDNQNESLNKDGHQNWYRLVLNDFHDGKQFEGLIHKYESWSEPSDEPMPEFRGIRGEGDIEKNRERAARRAKKKIRHACKSAQFDRMLTLTTRDAIFDREEFQKMIEKFTRFVRKATGEDLAYVLTVEKHDSIKTSEAKRGSLHAACGCARPSGLQAAAINLELPCMRWSWFCSGQQRHQEDEPRQYCQLHFKIHQQIHI
jgi:hypothetical protein